MVARRKSHGPLCNFIHFHMAYIDPHTHTHTLTYVALTHACISKGSIVFARELGT